jgi:hypothetical protein
VPFPLLCALLTNLFRIDVDPLSQLMPDDEFGVAKAGSYVKSASLIPPNSLPKKSMSNLE